MGRNDKKEEQKMNKQSFFYDQKNDILAIHKGFETNEGFKGNISIGKLILDVSTKGKIKGIEILDASEFLREFDIKKGILMDINSIDFNATKTPDSIVISLVIKSKNESIPAKIAVPIEN